MATGMKVLKSYNLNDNVNFLHYEKNFIFVIRFFAEILLTNNIIINIIYFDIKQLDIEIFFSVLGVYVWKTSVCSAPSAACTGR